MERLHNPFKRALKAGKLQIGLWHSLSSHFTVEILAECGFDWLLLDTEHSPNELPMIHTQLQAAAGSATHPVVRPAWNDQVVIKRMLDIGTQSFLIPFIETEEEALKAVASTQYPPKGVRGFASQSRASKFGRVKEYYARAEEEICVLLQIESQKGLANLERIARVEGVDGVFVGPGDLSAALGYLGQPTHPEVVKVIDDAIRRIKACGVAPGVLTGDTKLAQHYIEQGCRFTAVGSDIGVLVSGAEQLAKHFREQNPGR
jgi:4-hydroxy-2-oxoheptanedioate aldolase